MAAHHVLYSVLFLREGDFWIAQLLEHDISAQGSTMAAAKQALEQALLGQILLDRRMNREAFATLPQAPQRFWDMFRTASSRQLSAEPIDVDAAELPPAFMVQAFANSPQHVSA